MNKWQEKQIMWIVGSIDSNGAIHARVVPFDSKETSMHTAAESKGKRWRWSVFSQEFPMTQIYDMTKEETLAVLDWLVKNDYADQKEWDDCNRLRKDDF